MDTPASRLRKIREERGFKSARAAAKRFGWTESAYAHHENGTRPLTRVFAKYATAYRVSEAWLRCLSDDRNSGVRGVPVIGEAAVGVWRELGASRQPRLSEKAIDVPFKDNEDIENVRFSVRAADASVNKVLPQGGYAICVPLASRSYLPDDFRAGDVLYIERVRNNLKELSLRRVSHVNGERMRLTTYSTDAEIKQETVYPPANTTEKVRIIGRMVGKYIEHTSD